MTHAVSTLGMKAVLNTDFAHALEIVTAALKTEGFGVLTEIDVQATFKNKLNVDFRPYRILGACNPALAHRALTATGEVGLLLSCNVTVTQLDTGEIEVAIIDPIAMMDVMKHPDLDAIAVEARAKLQRVADVLRSA